MHACSSLIMGSCIRCGLGLHLYFDLKVFFCAITYEVNFEYKIIISPKQLKNCWRIRDRKKRVPSKEWFPSTLLLPFTSHFQVFSSSFDKHNKPSFLCRNWIYLLSKSCFTFKICFHCWIAIFFYLWKLFRYLKLGWNSL